MKNQQSPHESHVNETQLKQALSDYTFMLYQSALTKLKTGSQAVRRWRYSRFQFNQHKKGSQSNAPSITNNSAIFKKRKTKRKKMKSNNTAISRRIKQLHSVQFHSTKLNEFSQNFNAQLSRSSDIKPGPYCPKMKSTRFQSSKTRKVHNKTLWSVVQTSSHTIICVNTDSWHKLFIATQLFQLLLYLYAKAKEYNPNQ